MSPPRAARRTCDSSPGASPISPRPATVARGETRLPSSDDPPKQVKARRRAREVMRSVARSHHALGSSPHIVRSGTASIRLDREACHHAPRLQTLARPRQQHLDRAAAKPARVSTEVDPSDERAFTPRSDATPAKVGCRARGRPRSQPHRTLRRTAGSEDQPPLHDPGRPEA